MTDTQGKKTRANPMMEKDMEELRKAVGTLTTDMAKVLKQLKTLPELVSEVKQLKEIIREKDNTIDQLERRISELEQYSRIDDVIITGLKVRPRSYAKAVAEGGEVSEDAPAEDQVTLEMQVLEFFEKKNINIEASSISACHTLPRKDKTASPAIIMRFVSRVHKTALMMQGKKLKGTQVYVNEHLTKRNAEIAKEARILRKNGKIKSTWTRNCKVLVRLNGTTPEEAKTVTVRDLKDLEAYK